MIILILQILGFILALVAMFSPLGKDLMMLGFTVHFVGDLLFVLKEGLPRLKFDISKHVKLGPFLQFVGYMLMFGGMLALSHWFGKPLAYVAVGLSMAGFLYEKIYP